MAVIGVVIILGSLLGRGDSPGYSVVIAFVILVSSVPIGMPVVTTTVLAVGAREMAKQKAIVNRQAQRPDTSHDLSMHENRPMCARQGTAGVKWAWRYLLICLGHDWPDPLLQAIKSGRALRNGDAGIR